MDEQAMIPFRADIDQAVLDDLRERLGRTRWPEQIPGSGWDLGTDTSYLAELCAYWRDGYDWRSTEAELNVWPQFVTRIGGQQMHFIHARSPHERAMPLLITHGWPGSVFEFMKILGPLTDPVSYGGSPEDAFHVVAPSIPGYLFSGPTTERGWDVSKVAAAEDTLMTRLGYPSYGAQGGDWGSRISVELALAFPDHLRGIHLNLVQAGPPNQSDPSWKPTAEEAAEIARRERFARYERGYSAIQATKPQTLSYALCDSPVGLAAWIVEKFRTWSDCDGNVEKRFSKDELLANITGYWVTGTAGSAARLYLESWSRAQSPPSEYVAVPTGCALFPAEIAHPPRGWAEKVYNVVHWSEMAAGGHFAAMEEPIALVEDIRAFFRSLR
jgi:microsomal epoxide hydrolase